MYLETLDVIVVFFKSFFKSFKQGSFFGVKIRFLASEGGSIHKYTNQSQSLRILQPIKRTLVSSAYESFPSIK
jgi:hypothetical protein